ncbi:hypothetical protein [Enterococcus faecalis]|uniref:hypothetical protein n=1 Tax=Enterococcus faecalis TaxID=1351 RepID=UPI003CE51B3D
MACAGCERRREWLKKWAKVAYDRARGIVTDPATGRAAKDEPAATDARGSTERRD